jgi:hypothetical protein
MIKRLLVQVLREATYEALARLWKEAALRRRLDMLIDERWERRRQAHKNPLLRSGEKYYSQSDEDGITLAVLRRIGLSQGTFCEFGVGNGLENNSLVLLLGGWRGVWIGAEDLAFGVPSAAGPLRFLKRWVTAENAGPLLREGLALLSAEGPNVVSVDLDGNDLFVTSSILDDGWRPDLVVVEYNGKFPPPIRWTIRYEPDRRWDGTDYFGASLQSFVDLLGSHGYRLVCCNITGTNAFFVRNDHAGAFADVPPDPADVFVASDYVWFYERGHRPAPKTVEVVLNTVTPGRR